MKGYSSFSEVIDRRGGCTSEEKQGKAVKEQIKGDEKAKKRFVEELKKQVKAIDHISGFSQTFLTWRV